MASVQGQRVQTFVHTLNEDIKLYRQLQMLLAEQKTLYLAFNGDVLNENIHRQAPLLRQLHQNASKRGHCLQDLALPNSEQGVKRLFHALPPPLRSKVQQQWEMLSTLVHQCQSLNQDNGQSSALFHELLSQLTQPSPTYDTNIAGD